MQTWKEARFLAEKLIEYGEKGVRSALLTIVNVRGSSYRKEGAKFLVSEEGEEVCSISGGCLEKGLKEIAIEVIMSQLPKLERINMEDESSWGMWLGCPGEVDIYIEPFEYDEVNTAWLYALLDGKRCVLVKRLFSRDKALFTEDGFIGSKALDFREEAIYLLKQNLARPFLKGDVFFDVVLHYPCIHIFGKGEEAFYIKSFAELLGFKVYMHNPTERVNMDNSFVIIANHNLRADKICLKQAISSDAIYIGVVSSRKRLLKISEDLELDNRVYCPAGLDLGGFTPEEVALSIISEILKVYWGKTGESLRKIKQEVTNGTGS